MSDDTIYAPFTPEEVTQLNRYQAGGWFHPFTCRNDSGHSLLIATEAGWICPDCGYTQNWAHSVMASKEVLDELEKTFDSLKC